MPGFNKKEVIDALKLELSILEGGGYGRPVRDPHRETALLRDSITCLNVGDTVRQHPCGECFLIEQVPDSVKGEDIPCHHIPLNDKGETIESLERQGKRVETEEALAGWIRATLKRLESEPN